MSFELTPVGGLSLVALVLGILFGGTAQLVGFQLGANLEAQHLWLTPLVVVHLEAPPLSGSALTLGSTLLIAPGEHKSGIHETGNVLRYELGHVNGWMRYGLGYGIKVLAEPCQHDPRAIWAVCPSEERQRLPIAPTTGVFIWRWE